MDTVSYFNNSVTTKERSLAMYRMSARWGVAAVLAALLLVFYTPMPTHELTVFLPSAPIDPPTPRQTIGPTPTMTASQTPTPISTPIVEPTPTPEPTPSLMEGCTRAEGLSAPVYLEPEGLGRRDVQSLPPVNGVSPDPLDYNPEVFAWDNLSGELGPDDYKALFTAHTYSSRDTALGNQLQDHLDVGGIVRATNDAGETFCYEVVERLELPVGGDIEAIAARSGKGLLVITVCSGLVGKEWTTRTVWFARLLS